MTAIGHDGAVRGLIVDIGGVLVHDPLLDTSRRWADRLGMTLEDMLSAIYGGSDEAVLVGRVGEDEWWEIVGGRLDIDTSHLRAELESGQTWNDELVAVLRDAKSTSRTAILSNAWPSQRSRMDALRLTDLVHELLLSCEIGRAKPDVKAFETALERLGTAPGDTLFIDDTASHVEVAVSLGIRGHVHRTPEETVFAIRDFAIHPSE